MVVEPLIGEGLKGAAIEFIDYARWIISAMIIYYAIRFFTISSEEEDQKAEREWKERGEQYSEFINKTIDSSKAKDAARSQHIKDAAAQTSRKQNTAVAQSSLIKAVHEANKALDARSDVKLPEYKDHIEKFHKEIDHALKGLREKRAKFPASFNVNNHIATLQAQRALANSKLLDAAVMPTTNAGLRAVVEKDITDIRDALALILDAINTYITTP